MRSVSKATEYVCMLVHSYIALIFIANLPLEGSSHSGTLSEVLVYTLDPPIVD